MSFIIGLLLLAFTGYYLRRWLDWHQKIRGILDGNRILPTGIDIVFNSICVFVSRLAHPFNRLNRSNLKQRIEKFTPKSSKFSDLIFLNPLYEKKLNFFISLIFIYYFYSFLSTLFTYPVDASGERIPYIKNFMYAQAILAVLVGINALTDMLSIFITIADLRLASKALEKNKTSHAILFLIVDGIYAVFIFSISQVISNFLYLFPIGQQGNGNLLETTLSLETPFYPYRIVNPLDRLNGEITLTNIEFPGQLILTGTILFPTLLALILILSLIFAQYLVRGMIIFAKKNSRRDIQINPKISNVSFPRRVIKRASEKCEDHFINYAIASVAGITAALGMFLLFQT